jgi:hypothetical protein
VSVQPLDVVVLTHDVPAHGLRRGDLDTVVEIYAGNDGPCMMPGVVKLPTLAPTGQLPIVPLVSSSVNC